MCKILKFPTTPTTQSTNAPTSVAANGYATVSSELLKEYWVAEGFPVTDNLFAAGLLEFNEDGSMKPAATMSGGLCQNDSKREFAKMYQPIMLNELGSFAKKCCLQSDSAIIIDGSDDGKTALIAAPSDRGIYVAVWFTLSADIYLARQMLAFMLYCFAAMNCSECTGEIKDRKLWETYFKVQNDLRLGLDKTTARRVLTEYYNIA